MRDLIPTCRDPARRPGVRIESGHLGIILPANLAIGVFLPPLGINRFISSIRFEHPVLELYRLPCPISLS